MASDIFAKIGDIKGESIDKDHPGEIDVQSFSWGVTQTGTLAHGGGGGEGKAQFNDFQFSTNVSKASPALFLACASGTHIKEATISVRQAAAGDKGQDDYLVIKLSDVLVSSYQSQGSREGDRPTESLNMAFAKVEYSYRPQTARGGQEPFITVGWDLKANKKV